MCLISCSFSFVCCCFCWIICRILKLWWSQNSDAQTISMYSCVSLAPMSTEKCYSIRLVSFLCAHQTIIERWWFICIYIDQRKVEKNQLCDQIHRFYKIFTLILPYTHTNSLNWLLVKIKIVFGLWNSFNIIILFQRIKRLLIDILRSQTGWIAQRLRKNHSV